MNHTVAIVFGGIFLTVVTPVWIVFNYLSQRRVRRGLSAENAQRLATLWASADAMEARVTALEKAVGVSPEEPGAASDHRRPDTGRPASEAGVWS